MTTLSSALAALEDDETICANCGRDLDSHSWQDIAHCERELDSQDPSIPPSEGGYNG